MPTKPAELTPDAVTVTPPDATPDAVVAAIPELHYIVLHEGVGNWVKGNIITTTDLKNIDVDRLLRLNAIAVHQE